jgi:hypothetical protein
MPHFLSSFQGLKIKVSHPLTKYLSTSFPAFFDETIRNLIQKMAEIGAFPFENFYTSLF